MLSLSRGLVPVNRMPIIYDLNLRTRVMMSPLSFGLMISIMIMIMLSSLVIVLELVKPKSTLRNIQKLRFTSLVLLMISEVTMSLLLASFTIL